MIRRKASEVKLWRDESQQQQDGSFTAKMNNREDNVWIGGHFTGGSGFFHSAVVCLYRFSRMSSDNFEKGKSCRSRKKTEENCISETQENHAVSQISKFTHMKQQSTKREVFQCVQLRRHAHSSDHPSAGHEEPVRLQEGNWMVTEQTTHLAQPDSRGGRYQSWAQGKFRAHFMANWGGRGFGACKDGPGKKWSSCGSGNYGWRVEKLQKQK